MDQPPGTDAVAAGGNRSEGAAPQDLTVSSDPPRSTNSGLVGGGTDPADHGLYRRSTINVPLHWSAAPSPAAPAPEPSAGPLPADPSAGPLPADPTTAGPSTDGEIHPADHWWQLEEVEAGPGWATTRSQPLGGTGRLDDTGPMDPVDLTDEPGPAGYATGAEMIAPPPPGQDPFPPYALVDDLFLGEGGPDLPTPVTAPLPGGNGAPAGPLRGAAVAPSAGRRRLRRSIIAGAVVVALVATGGVAFAVLRPDGGPGVGRAVSGTSDPGGASQPGGASGARADANQPEPGGSGTDSGSGRANDPATTNSIAVALDGRQEATFDLTNGTTTVNVRAETLGDDLLRASTPVGSSVVPRPVVGKGGVQLQLTRSGEDGPGVVDIVLNAKVRWTLRTTGGAVEHSIDMSDGLLSGVELFGGATRIDLTLPRVNGTVRIRMTGGVNQFAVRTPPGTPVRLRIGSGATQVVLDGRTHRGIAPGSIFSPNRWTKVENRVDLEAIAGVGTFTLTRY